MGASAQEGAPRSPEDQDPFIRSHIESARGFLLTLQLKLPEEPDVVWSLGPKALNYESLQPLVKKASN